MPGKKNRGTRDLTLRERGYLMIVLITAFVILIIAIHFNFQSATAFSLGQTVVVLPGNVPISAHLILDISWFLIVISFILVAVFFIYFLYFRK